MMTWSKDLQLSPVAEVTEAGSVPVLLKPKSVEDTCKLNLSSISTESVKVQYLKNSFEDTAQPCIQVSSKNFWLSETKTETEAGSVPVLLKQKSVEDTCKIEF